MKLLYLILFTIFLTSCEGFVIVSGNIKSAKDNSNISNAKIELLDVPTFDTLILSDTNGNFTVSSKMIGMVKSPKYRIRVTKDKFKPVEIKFNDNSKEEKLINDSLKIKLEEY